VTYTSPAHFRELAWLRRQLDENVYGFDEATLALLLKRQDILERRAVEENIVADLNGAIRGDHALGAFLTGTERLRRQEENQSFAARGWRMPWDDYPADLDSPLGEEVRS
jgi:hypothetical protein